MDYNEIIANALKQQEMANNAAMQPPSMPVPGVNTGKPILDDTMLRDIMSRAFAPNPTQQQDDLSSARMKMWSAMAQPRQPGQSTAGNITAAMQGGVSAIDAANEARRAQALQQGQVASAIATQDTARRANEQAMNMAAQKFPAEMQQLSLQLKALQDEGKLREATLLKTAIETNPELMAQRLRDSQKKTDAEIAKVEAETKLAGSRGILAEKTGEYYDRGGASKAPAKATLTKLDNGNAIRMNPDGSMEYVIPGDTAYTPEMARKELLKEAKGKTSWYQSTPDPTPEQISARVAERQKTRVIPLSVDADGNVVQTSSPTPTPATPTTTGPSSGVKPPIDLSALVREKQTPNRAVRGKIRSAPIQVPEQSIQSSMQVPNNVQLARDEAAIELIRREMQSPDITEEELIQLQRDLEARLKKIKKSQS